MPDKNAHQSTYYFCIVPILKTRNVSSSHNRHKQGLEKLTQYTKDK